MTIHFYVYFKFFMFSLCLICCRTPVCNCHILCSSLYPAGCKLCFQMMFRPVSNVTRQCCIICYWLQSEDTLFRTRTCLTKLICNEVFLQTCKGIQPQILIINLPVQSMKSLGQSKVTVLDLKTNWPCSQQSKFNLACSSKKMHDFFEYKQRMSVYLSPLRTVLTKVYRYIPLQFALNDVRACDVFNMQTTKMEVQFYTRCHYCTRIARSHNVQFQWATCSLQI